MIASWDVAREEKIRITVEKTAYLLRRDLRFSALKSLLEESSRRAARLTFPSGDPHWPISGSFRKNLTSS
jgi:hypothetical protein